jgi:hypothetical protein
MLGNNNFLLYAFYTFNYNKEHLTYKNTNINYVTNEYKAHRRLGLSLSP